MELLADNGINVIKPMMFNKAGLYKNIYNKNVNNYNIKSIIMFSLLKIKAKKLVQPYLSTNHLEFLNLLMSFSAAKPSKQFSPPLIIQNAVTFLRNQGCKYISLLGLCWGGQVTQKLASTGIFMNRCIPNHTPYIIAYNL